MSEQRCLAEEWHRDGRGLWAMRSCQLASGHSARHGFARWHLNVQSPAEAAEARVTALAQREAELQDAAKRAAAELRHAFATIYKGQMDTGLVSRAVKLLERATTPPALASPSTPSPGEPT